MTIQERKRYNLVIFILFAAGFVLFGGMSLLFWIVPHPTSGFYDVPFQSLPMPIRPVLAFLVFGLMGGFMISSQVGGYWLGGRYVAKQGKPLIIAACVLFPFTWIVFTYVGFFLTIPFFIYNVVKIKRSPVKEALPMPPEPCTPPSPPVFQPQASAPVADAQVYFECNNHITKDTYEELKWRLFAKTTIIWAVMALVFLCLAVWSTLHGYLLVSFINLMFCLLFVSWIVQTPKTSIKSFLDREFESTGSYDSYRAVRFTDDGIHIFSANTGGTSRYGYDCIKKLIETKNTYTLVTQTEQFLVVYKMTLGHQCIDFVQFLKARCPNLKTKNR